MNEPSSRDRTAGISTIGFPYSRRSRPQPSARRSAVSAAPRAMPPIIVRVYCRVVSAISIPRPARPSSALAGRGQSSKDIPPMSWPRSPSVRIFGRRRSVPAGSWSGRMKSRESAGCIRTSATTNEQRDAFPISHFSPVNR